MAYLKHRVCESTDIANKVFGMFQNGTINLVTDRNDPAEPLVPYRDDEYAPQEDEVPPFDQLKLDYIQRLLTNWCREVWVNDVVKTDLGGDCYKNTRVVRYFVNKPGQRTPIVFTIAVQQQYIDGDEVSGLTDWKIVRVEIQIPSSSTTEILELQPLNFRDKSDLSPMMRDCVGNLLIFV